MPFYYLRFIIKGELEDLVFHVSKDAWKMVESSFDEHTNDPSGHFLSFKTLEGQLALIHMGDIQGVRFLWEPFAGDAAHENYDEEDEAMKIKLRGASIIECNYIEDTEVLLNFVSMIEESPLSLPYQSFVDEDGEGFTINLRELVWLIFPGKWLTPR